MRIGTLIALILFAAGAPLAAQPPAATQLDFLAGDWEISDSSGSVVGRSHIDLQAPGAMLFELRRVGDEAQPLWFALSERNRAWTQLFVGAAGMVREFAASSAAGAWPLVMVGDVILRDGTPARFRLTMARESDDATSRLLEMSRDNGASWNIVFDYRYRRGSAQGGRTAGE
jgi:hypothetical protein